jgi:hypothetical protein
MTDSRQAFDEPQTIPISILQSVKDALYLQQDLLAHQLLDRSQAAFRFTGYLLPNATVHCYALDLDVDGRLYALVVKQKEQIEWRILEMLQRLLSQDPDQWIESVSIRLKPSRISPNSRPLTLTSGELIRLIGEQRRLMTAAATGIPCTPTARMDYRLRRARIAQGLHERKLEDPNRFSELDDWVEHGKETFATYGDRSRYLEGLYAGILEQLRAYLPAQSQRGSLQSEIQDWIQHLRHLPVEQVEDFEHSRRFCALIFTSLASQVQPNQPALLPSRLDNDTHAAACILHGFIDQWIVTSLEPSVGQMSHAAIDLAEGMLSCTIRSRTELTLLLEAVYSVLHLFAALLDEHLADPYNSTVPCPNPKVMV